MTYVALFFHEIGKYGPAHILVPNGNKDKYFYFGKIFPFR